VCTQPLPLNNALSTLASAFGNYGKPLAPYMLCYYAILNRKKLNSDISRTNHQADWARMGHVLGMLRKARLG